MECDHCFVYSGPNAKGTFTLNHLRDVFDEIAKIGTIEWVYFEGGEPFLFYPLMLEGIKIAHDMGFKTGVVTNAYWAISEEDAELWLRPFCELEISDLSVSDDSFHYEDERDNPAKRALIAATKLGIPVNTISVEKCTIEAGMDKEPVIGGGAMFRGRAVEKLTEGLPKRWWEEFTECPYEDLKDPKRIHIDPYGHVHICQGLSIGNIWEFPLSKIVKDYDANSHPICRPLIRGGPALLAKEYNVKLDDEYIDACNICYLVRLALLDKFPKYLAPRQVYGLE